jgi:tetratricopeptide (TPR) repeat protein
MDNANSIKRLLKSQRKSKHSYLRLSLSAIILLLIYASLCPSALSSEPNSTPSQSETTKDNLPEKTKLEKEPNKPPQLLLSNNKLAHQLQRAWLAMPDATDNSQNSQSLQNMIQQVQSLKLTTSTTDLEPYEVTPVPKIPAKIEPNDIELQPIITPEPNQQTPTIEPQPDSSKISPQTLKIIRTLVQDPNKCENSFNLAEVLFKNKNLKEAATFYRMALNRNRQDTLMSANDKAWMLFQIGNCLRDINPTDAQKAYRELIDQYPDSQWVETAKVRNKLIQWFENEKPWALIKDPNSLISNAKPNPGQ